MTRFMAPRSLLSVDDFDPGSSEGVDLDQIDGDRRRSD
jgi:hypothetical protein